MGAEDYCNMCDRNRENVSGNEGACGQVVMIS